MTTARQTLWQGPWGHISKRIGLQLFAQQQFHTHTHIRAHIHTNLPMSRGLKYSQIKILITTKTWKDILQLLRVVNYVEQQGVGDYMQYPLCLIRL